jgi:hypothetical protein
MDSAMPVHTLSPQFCPEIAQARSTNEIGATPQKELADDAQISCQ